MAFRAKSPQRTVNEIEELVRRYKIRRLTATDNIISVRGLDRFADLLSGLDEPFDLFYEIKANIVRSDVELLRRAKITRVQPGIESFSDDLLRLMKKGTTGLQNVNALRWCRRYGIEPMWNLLYGFPGEALEMYRDQELLIRRMHHLRPPFSMSRVRVDRFSPNYEDELLRSSFDNVKPLTSYKFVFPPELDLDRAAAFFEGQPRGGVSDEQLTQLRDEIYAWKVKWDRVDEFWSPAETRELIPFLTYIPNENGAVIVGGRATPASPKRFVLNQSEDEAYRLIFERPIRLSALATGTSEILHRLDEEGLLARSGDFVLALAIDEEKSREFLDEAPA